jgi:hypothetical protein
MEIYMKKSYSIFVVASLLLCGAGTVQAASSEQASSALSGPIALTDSEMDRVAAGTHGRSALSVPAIFSTTTAYASADVGTAFALSFTQTIMRGKTTITQSYSIAFATGQGVVASTSAASGAIGRFGRH